MTLQSQRIGLDFTRATIDVTRASLESVVGTLKHHSRQCINLESADVLLYVTCAPVVFERNSWWSFGREYD